MSPTPGDEVSYVVTWLEMTRRPSAPPAPLPMNAPVSLMRAVRPPVAYFLYLYDMVGAAYHWTDRHADSAEALRAWLHDDDVALFAMLHDGWPGGFFVLDWREAGRCELAYFGLAEQLHGRGLGKWLLGEAVRMGWDREGVEKMTVNTCSLDDPRALPLYQRAGFEPVRRTEATRIIAPARRG
ncbi:GNAT family N-acetyltransferase [Oceanicella actignis]|uniref:GNAT family N-acetyltransferase n=1 Tax=Oceanicella actignis TaxID=1189325 RepID=UPI0011E86C5B|nr:GNAT family N-acetyltransferase [Oceanicella actignis]TYO88534.1 ribosomal protein S18 acetylase RimI-like enzyme [Oceanicella actignis]